MEGDPDGALEVALPGLRHPCPDARSYHDIWRNADRDPSIGERAAVMYTLIGTAKLNDVAPQAWLADVLDRIAESPQTCLHEPLPWHWKTHRLQALAA